MCILVILLRKIYRCCIISLDVKITKMVLYILLGTKRQTSRKDGTQSHRPKATENCYGGWVAETYVGQPTIIGSPDLAGCFFIIV
jgi:hypothetical protein